ncbi:MAG TPA: hypothetical protein PLG89_09735 [Arenimonas sp.]|nr:hypothetical protein [Arenimonas sp.]
MTTPTPPAHTPAPVPAQSPAPAAAAALPPGLPALASLRPLLWLLLFFAVWSQRVALQEMADATSATLVQLAAACGDPNR